MWQVFFCLSVLATIVGLGYIFIARNKKEMKVAPVNLLLCAIFAANTLMFMPMYYSVFGNDEEFSLVFKTILVSMHHALRLFIVDCDFEMVKDMVPDANALFYYAYTCYASILFLLSPVLTFSFIFSFFKNVSAHRKYISNYNKDAYIFSEVDEESIELALSIKEKFNDCIIIFTNFSEENSQICELDKKIKSMRAIVFKKDILSLNFMFHNKKKNINFFLFGREESANIKYALGIIQTYNKRKNTQLYVLSNEIEGEVLLNAAQTEEIKVRRISNVRTMIYSILQDKGSELFDNAVQHKETGKRLISAVIVGLGKYGSEMTKALAWFCQMEGYRIEIDVYEKDSCAENLFASMCPELMDKEHNDKFDDPGEAQYRIGIHAGIDVNTFQFCREIKKLGNTTYVFIALGNDEANIRTSIKLRTLFERMGIKPKIQAIVEDSERKKSLADIKNYSNQPYDIEYVGSVDEIYSYGNIINSRLEREALERHLCWGEENDFWKYEYNYRSSMASALHRRMKKICHMSGIEKVPAERTEEEKHTLRLLEHRRWNAYMRSEGFVYSPKRNNLAKTHHCLVTFDLLSQADKEKDDD